MHGIRLALALACCLWSADCLAQSADVPRVDVALVLTVDASGSIDTEEFQLQKEGIASAVAAPEVLSTIKSGRNGRIAIAYVEWGSPGGAQLVVDWMVVNDEASASDFGNAVLEAPRSIQSYNAIGDAIDLSVKLFETCPCRPTRRVIDVSGDNPDNRSHLPAPLARDAAVAQGVTINALAILQDGRLGPEGRPWLVEAYERTIIGGFGAFAIAASSRADFARALREKMVMEISGICPARESDLAQRVR
ncbi:DUF1194 domain-containing protein [Dongia deserti]|uniref:DUF1194 domain-containing protein n=1 Tax=Dongia deserti TaxID=2268030 RepID=UPI000E6570B5|nr:DUF1194 domain-containing protein [Dongia deserti]